MTLCVDGPCSFNNSHQHLLRRQYRFMKICLPVHQPPCHQKLFNRVDRFFFHHQFAIANGEHFNNAVVTDNAFTYAGKKTIPAQVVHAVYIELPAYELVEEFFRMVAGKNIDGYLQLTLTFGVLMMHYPQAHSFVPYIPHE